MELENFYQTVFTQSRQNVGSGFCFGDERQYFTGGEYVQCNQDFDGVNFQVNSSDNDSGYCTSPLSPEYSCKSSNSPSIRLPRIPPIEVLQQRRLAANARERKRAGKINNAFTKLRQVLPGFKDREISKYEAIRIAQDYIKHLVQMLEQDDEKKQENKQDEGHLEK